MFLFWQIRIKNKIIIRMNAGPNIIVKTYLSEEDVLEMKEGIRFKKRLNTPETTK